MLHENLKRLRNEYGITRTRLASYMHTDEQKIKEWEAGVSEPSIQQLHRLAKLYDISLDELIEGSIKEAPTEAYAVKNDQKKRGKKKKKRTKTKHKTKQVEKTTVEKKRTWPLVILLVLLIASGIASVVYWKYGGNYMVVSKKDDKVSKLAGTFVDQNKYQETQASLTLQSNATFTLQFHNCSILTSMQGTWSIEKDVITLQAASGTSYTLRVQNNNQLMMTSSIDCSPKKKDIFTRGGLAAPSPQPSEPSKDKEEPTPNTTPSKPNTANIAPGQWSGDHSTLNIQSVHNNTAIFTLQSYDPQDASHVAKLTNVQGTIQGNTIAFHFDNDGYGNAGDGTIDFQATSAIFHITKTTTNKDAPWAIMDHGTLEK